jgi:hypothetical protein
VVYLYMDSAQAAFGPAWRRLARRFRRRRPAEAYGAEPMTGAEPAAEQVRVLAGGAPVRERVQAPE